MVEKLKEKFLIGSAESINFTYVGLRIKSYKDGLTIDQNQYIAGLDMIPINKKKSIRKEGSIGRKGKERIQSLSW